MFPPFFYYPPPPTTPFLLLLSHYTHDSSTCGKSMIALRIAQTFDLFFSSIKPTQIIYCGEVSSPTFTSYVKQTAAQLGVPFEIVVPDGISNPRFERSWDKRIKELRFEERQAVNSLMQTDRQTRSPSHDLESLLPPRKRHNPRATFNTLPSLKGDPQAFFTFQDATHHTQPPLSTSSHPPNSNNDLFGGQVQTRSSLKREAPTSPEPPIKKQKPPAPTVTNDKQKSNDNSLTTEVQPPETPAPTTSDKDD